MYLDYACNEWNEMVHELIYLMVYITLLLNMILAVSLMLWYVLFMIPRIEDFVDVSVAAGEKGCEV